MNGKFLLDTNAILYLLSGNSCMSSYADCKFVFSVISELECLCFSKLSKTDELQIKSFLRTGSIKGISKKIKSITIEIRKNYNLQLPDAIVAATAIALKLPLISADKVFKKVLELNWIELEP